MQDLPRSESSVPGRDRSGVPELPAGVVVRERLFSRLDSSVADSAVTTVVAPPGWGKTQLLASWVPQRLEAAPISWITVDERHSDPTTFWPEVLSRFGSPDTTGSRRRAASDTDLAFTDTDNLAIPFFDVLSHLATPVLLILDDVHLLDGTRVQSELAWLLARLPSFVTVILSGVYIPDLHLCQVKLHQRVRSLTTEDLSFRPNEIGELFATSGVTVTSEQAEQLYVQTEGWSAALRLAALECEESMPVSTAKGKVSRTFKIGSDIDEYLAAEVLSHIPTDTYLLLLHTCICDIVNADLAHHLTGRVDAATVLADLAHRNLFVTAVSPDNSQYRYHTMLADLLRRELRGNHLNQLRMLHSLAAQWFCDQGDYIHAFHHACHGNRWDFAVALMLESWLGLYLDGEMVTARKMVELLPDNVVESNDELLAVATVLSLSLDEGPAHDPIDPRLNPDVDTSNNEVDVIAASEDSPGLHPLATSLPESPSTTAAALVLDLARGRRSGDLTEVSVAVRAIEDLRKTQVGTHVSGDLRALALLQLATTEYWVGRRAYASDHIIEALVAAQSADRPYLELCCLGQFVCVLTAQNRMSEAIVVADQAAALAHDRGWELTEAAAVLWHGRGWAAYVRGNFIAAEENLSTGLAAVRRTDNAVRATLLLVRGLTVLHLGRPSDALTDLEEATRLVNRMPARYIFTDYLIWGRTRALIAHRNIRDAQDYLAQYPVNPHGPMLTTVAHAELLVALGQREDALALIGQGIDSGRGLRDEILIAMVMAACLHATTGCAQPPDPKSVELLSAAIELAAPEQVISPFLLGGPTVETLLRGMPIDHDYHVFINMVRKRLGSNGIAASDQSSPHPNIALTPRELESLRLICEPASLPEIAEKMFVSVNTLKVHLRSLYRKLEVSNRRHAVLRGRELGLI